jgi:hypothetical protein
MNQEETLITSNTPHPHPDNLFEEALLKPVYKEAPSILSSMDKRRYSQTYGCFDPLFWQRQKVEFANVRAQEAALTLALLYSKNYPNNPYYHKKELAESAVAAFDYWTKLQHRDGSFDENRHLEHGQAGTAFSVVAMTSAFEMINRFLESELKKRCLACFRKSADFLARNSDIVYVNHEAVSIYATYLCYCILKKRKYIEAAKKKLVDVTRAQSSEGWFREGAGADTGYNTVTLSYLALYYSKSNDEAILSTLKKAVEFNSYFLYPDGFTGGGFNSRFTGMLFPLGFIILADRIFMARQLAFASLRSLKDGKMDGLFTLDYIRKCMTLYFLLWGYEEAKRKLFKDTERYSPVLENVSFVRYMGQAKIMLIKKPAYYLVIGTRNACIGALYACNPGQTIQMSSPTLSNCISGIYGRTTRGFVVSTQFSICKHQSLTQNWFLSSLLIPAAKNVAESDPDTGKRIIDRQPLLFTYHLACELGLRPRIMGFYERVQHIVAAAGRRTSTPLLQLNRKIAWENDTVNVSNELNCLRDIEFEELYAVETFILPRKGSSRIVTSRNGLDYLIDQEKVMTMRVDADGFQLREDDETSLRFNDVKPVVLLLPLSMQNGKSNVSYSIEFEHFEKKRTSADSGE